MLGLNAAEMFCFVSARNSDRCLHPCRSFFDKGIICSSPVGCDSAGLGYEIARGWQIDSERILYRAPYPQAEKSGVLSYRA